MAGKQRTWKCAGCGTRNPRRKQNCAGAGCKRKRPKPRKPAHKKILEVPYELWSKAYGDNCNICGAEPKPNKRHDRDHDHASGAARGVLCSTCNRRLTNRITPEWLEKAAEYLRRPPIDLGGLT